MRVPVLSPQAKSRVNAESWNWGTWLNFGAEALNLAQEMKVTKKMPRGGERRRGGDECLDMRNLKKVSSK